MIPINHVLRTSRVQISMGWRSFSLNSLGLGIGISVFTLASLFIYQHLTYDNWANDPDSIYRVEVIQNKPGRSPKQTQSAPGVLMTLVAGIRSVEASAAAFSQQVSISKSGRVHHLPMTFVSESFFEFFPVEVIEGHANIDQLGPYSILLTEASARTLFGEGSVVGKELVTQGGRLVVSGVIENWPKNSHLEISSLAGFESVEFFDQELYLDWGSIGGSVYLKVVEGTSIGHTLQELENMVRKKAPRLYSEGYPGKGIAPFYDYQLRPLQRIVFDSKGPGMSRQGTGYSQIILLGTLGVLTFLIALLNHVGMLSTHIALNAKSYAIRRIAGATGSQLSLYIISLSFLQSLAASAVALVIISVLWPMGTSQLDIYNPIGDYKQLETMAILLVAALISTLLGMIATPLLRALPVPEAIRSITSLNPRSKLAFFSVMTQFFMAAGLVCFCMIMASQVRYLDSKHAGMDYDGVSVVWGLTNKDHDAKRFKARLISSGYANEVAGTLTVPGEPSSYSMSVKDNSGGNSTLTMRYLVGDRSFPSILRMQPVAGRLFSEDRAADLISDSVESTVPVLLNLTAAIMMGFENPTTVPGNSIQIIYGDKWRVAEIIGVVADFHFDPLFSKIEPTLIIADENAGARLLVRLKDEMSIDVIDQVWTDMGGSSFLEHGSVDGTINARYYWEISQLRLILLVAAVSVVVASVGLLGTTLKIADSYKRDVAIHRVLGAPLAKLVANLAVKFSSAAFTGLLLAIPVSYYFGSDWLSSFSYRIDDLISPVLIGLCVISSIITAAIGGSIHRLVKTQLPLLLKVE